MSGTYARRPLTVEAWQNDDAGPAMPYWLEQISARERGGVVRVNVAAAASVPAQLGDYVVLYPDGHVAVMDPGTFDVQFAPLHRGSIPVADNVIPIGSFGFARGAIVRRQDGGPNMIVVRGFGDVTACILCEGEQDGALRLKEFPTRDLKQLLASGTPGAVVDGEPRHG